MYSGNTLHYVMDCDPFITFLEEHKKYLFFDSLSFIFIILNLEITI